MLQNFCLICEVELHWAWTFSDEMEKGIDKIDWRESASFWHHREGELFCDFVQIASMYPRGTLYDLGFILWVVSDM